jgi:cobalt/nickel transport system permease protein
VHISEGVLSPPVLGAGAAVAAAGLAVGLRRLDWDRLPQTAILAAGFFVASLVHVPIGPAKAHLVLNGLLGLLLGWAAFPALFVGVALQAVLFQYGGLTTLGVNTASMALPAVVLGLACGRLVGRGRGAAGMAAAFAAGAGSVLGSALLVAAALALSGEAFLQAAQLIVLAHLPVMAIEGVITAVIVSFLWKVRPALLPGRAGGGWSHDKP